MLACTVVNYCADEAGYLDDDVRTFFECKKSAEIISLLQVSEKLAASIDKDVRKLLGISRGVFYISLA
jgi:hypothetical protein